MTKTELIASIGTYVNSNPKIWYVGITDDLNRRKGEHASEGESVTCWQGWKADSEQIARDVEKHFLDKGCKGGPGGGTNPTYVYIF